MGTSVAKVTSRPAEARPSRRAVVIDGLGFAAALLGFGLLLSRVAGGDFAAYYLAGQGFLQGLDFYQREAIESLASAAGIVGDLGPFLYPPLFAMGVVPLAGLDYVTARWLWFALSATGLVSALLLLKSVTGLRLGPGWRGPAVAFVAFFTPIGDDLLKGQVSWLLLLLLVAAWWALRGRRPYLGGTLIALATTIKLAPALFVVHLGLRRELRATAASLVAGTALLMISVLALGIDRHLTFLFDTMPFIGVQVGSTANISLAGAFTRFFDPGSLAGPLWPNPWLHVVGTAAASLIVLAVFVRDGLAQPRPKAADEGFALVAICMLLLTPSSRAYTLVVGVMALAVIFARFRASPEPDWHLFDALLIAVLLLAIPPDIRLEPGLAAGLGIVQTPTGPLALLLPLIPTLGLILTLVLLVRTIDSSRGAEPFPGPGKP
ncbi:MAG: glycosyltransferase family 87 protein [Chloroflexota bacterium]